MSIEEEITRLVRRAVHDLLARSPGYHALPPAVQQGLGVEMARVGSALANSRSPASRASAGEHAGADVHPSTAQLPRFCAELIEGTFQAVVNASIEQMKAYAELLGSVSTSGWTDDTDRRREEIRAMLEPSIELRPPGWPPKK